MALSLYKVEVGYNTKNPTQSGVKQKNTFKGSVRHMPGKKALKFHLIFPTKFELYRETLNFRETASVQVNPKMIPNVPSAGRAKTNNKIHKPL